MYKKQEITKWVEGVFAWEDGKSNKPSPSVRVAGSVQSRVRPTASHTHTHSHSHTHSLLHTYTHTHTHTHTLSCYLALQILDYKTLYILV
jgi:hypothetical protein